MSRAAYRRRMPVVYILECADGSFYTGSSRDLPRRFDQHSTGRGAAYTRHRLPVTLVWHSELARMDDAFLWEKRIQGWTRAKKQALIDGRYDDLAGWSSRERKRRRGGPSGS